MAASSPLSTLTAALEHAEGTFRMCAPAQHEAALLEALSVLGNLYGTLDGRSPESTDHLNATFDFCIKALGCGFNGNFDPLTEATNRVRAIASMFDAPETIRLFERLAA